MDPEILQLFYLNPGTGELSVLKVLDYEAFNESDPKYTFTVEATDAGGTMPPGLASVTVRIMVGVCLTVISNQGQKHNLNLYTLEEKYCSKFSVFLMLHF